MDKPIGFTACWKPNQEGRCRNVHGHADECISFGFEDELKNHKVLLFLDFDGVLHPYPFHWGFGPMFSGVKQLKEVLADHAEVGVVVHSSWRTEYKLISDVNDLQNYLQLGPTLLGMTDPEILGRWESIEAWLKTDNRPYVILDDFASSFPSHIRHRDLICPQSIVGMMPEDWKELRRRLEAFRGE